MRMPRSGEIGPKHVVILGAGFGGLYAARELRRAPVRITLIDQRNHHLFQPMLYHTAGASSQPAVGPEKLQGIRHIVAVAVAVAVGSGKGGVGKSTMKPGEELICGGQADEAGWPASRHH